MLEVAVRGLPSMFLPRERSFAFTARRQVSGEVRPEGESLRYSAIVTLGAALLPESYQRPIFGGATAREHCEALLSQVDVTEDVGAAALVTWAAAELGHTDVERAGRRLLQLLAKEGPGCRTVEAAWSLSALLGVRANGSFAAAATQLRNRLLDAVDSEASIFPHRMESSRGLRAHIACFADQVYPIQALSRQHAALGDLDALAAADRCAARICALMGEAGQWWWHYDSRKGGVIEGYPVYSIHQDAMAPMCLFELTAAGGANRDEAIARGLRWLERPPEVEGSLIDENRNVIWRKVARRDRAKLVRALRGFASLGQSRSRLDFLERWFPPTAIDYECRPYHFGWMLYAWLLPH
jgi:hypothetical protein